MVGEDERVGLQLRRVVKIGSGSDTLVNEGILARNIPPSGDGCDSLTGVGVVCDGLKVRRGEGD